MTWWHNADAIAAVLVSVVSAIASIVAARMATHTKQQTSNGHKTNLRADLDRVLATVERIEASQSRDLGLARSHGHQLGEIRRDLSDAVSRHEDDVKRLEDQLRRRPGSGDSCP